MIHSHFLRRCCVLGVVGIGVLTVRLCDDWLPAGTFDALPPLWREGLCVAAVLAAEAVVLMQTIALWCIGQVTLTQSRWRASRSCRSFCFMHSVQSVQDQAGYAG